jgi:hypothetical protein
MENHLEPLYEAFERLNKAKEDGNHDLVEKIEEEMQGLRKKAVEESKRKGSMHFYNKSGFGSKL